MIKDYILKLQEENKERLTSLESEMQDLTGKLSDAEHSLAQMEQQKQMNKNIFSPRNIDLSSEDKVKQTDNEIARLKQRMDTVSRMIEVEIEKKDEYRIMSEEVSSEENSESEKEKDTDLELQISVPEYDMPAENDEYIHSSTEENERENSEQERNTELMDFLESVLNKIEFSLTFLKKNKNRCRAELEDTERMIENFMQKAAKQ